MVGWNTKIPARITPVSQSVSHARPKVSQGKRKKRTHRRYFAIGSGLHIGMALLDKHGGDPTQTAGVLSVWDGASIYERAGLTQNIGLVGQKLSTKKLNPKCRTKWIDIAAIEPSVSVPDAVSRFYHTSIINARHLHHPNYPSGQGCGAASVSYLIALRMTS